MLDASAGGAEPAAAPHQQAVQALEVHVDAARDREQAKRVAKAIVNSPLVKTAVHGADPNWGRVLASIGTYHDFCLDVLKVSGEGVMRNEHALTLLEAVHDSQRRMEREARHGG